MRPRGWSVLALGGLFGAATASAAAMPQAAASFELLPALHFQSEMTRQSLDAKLYDAQGRVDEAVAAQLDELLCDARSPKHHDVGRIDRRTLQLLFKAAYHFGVSEVEIVSAYRKPGRRREGPHGTGSAIDFRLQGVSAPLLAAYLRQIPRTGVGVYTHPKTQFVHLDNREHSFHWLDASPPRRHWRERSLGERDLAARDRGYVPQTDLPEGLSTTATTAANAR